MSELWFLVNDASCVMGTDRSDGTRGLLVFSNAAAARACAATYLEHYPDRAPNPEPICMSVAKACAYIEMVRADGVRAVALDNADSVPVQVFLDDLRMTAEQRAAA